MDPPAFTKGKEREEAERQALEQGEDVVGKGKGKAKEKGKGKKAGKKRKGKRKRGEETEDEEDEQPAGDPNPDSQPPLRQPLDPSILNDSILADAIPIPQPGVDNSNIDPALLAESIPGLNPPEFSTTTPALSPPPTDLIEEGVSEALAEEVAIFLQGSQGTLLTEALNEAEERRLSQITVVDELLGLNEEELDRFILSEEEVKIKERVWVELNREYLEALAAKGNQDGTTTKSRKRRKTNTRPRDASTAAGDTAAESVRNLIKKNPKYSKRINYDALKDLFVESGGSPSVLANMTTGDDEKDDAELFTMDDDKSDGEGMLNPTVIVEEEPGSVASWKPPSEPEKTKKKMGMMALEDMDMDEDASDDDKDDDALGWEDAYEQEV
ncbi:hypothetical protein NLJ89_g10106 [Agrocybe chaxingu]|uniref:Brf1 TBP-binding domain-containing protein n=1 Tax=Agrocybe chaxingu TaxID=84603 RepID=A0A9W8MP86_9AGAR|nr:hypothetical protein NLJ89_g10106 [Agrocybe chaxingu]